MFTMAKSLWEFTWVTWTNVGQRQVAAKLIGQATNLTFELAILLLSHRTVPRRVQGWVVLGTDTAVSVQPVPKAVCRSGYGEKNSTGA